MVACRPDVGTYREPVPIPDDQAGNPSRRSRGGPSRPTSCSATATRSRWSGSSRRSVAHELRYRAHWGPRHGDGEDDLTRYTYRWTPAFGRAGASVAKRPPWSAPASARSLSSPPGAAAEPPSRHPGSRCAFRPAPESDAVIRHTAMLQGLAVGGTRPADARSPARACRAGSSLAQFYRHTIIPDEAPCRRFCRGHDLHGRATSPSWMRSTDWMVRGCSSLRIWTRSAPRARHSAARSARRTVTPC